MSESKTKRRISTVEKLRSLAPKVAEDQPPINPTDLIRPSTLRELQKHRPGVEYQKYAPRPPTEPTRKHPKTRYVTQKGGRRKTRRYKKVRRM